MLDEQTLRILGIRQRGDQTLREPARRVDMGRESGLVAATVSALRSALGAARHRHPFAKGCGLAATQLGLPLAVAIVYPPGRGMVTLINPRVTRLSDQTDLQYEGCLSFFHQRGRVARPRWVEVECLVGGDPTVRRYDDGTARLVLHEIDHLNGVLYVDRMEPDEQLIPAGECPAAGQPWQYEETR